MSNESSEDYPLPGFPYVRHQEPEELVRGFLSTVATFSELGDCGFCPDQSVMIVNGISMCQRCGDENRDLQFHRWLAEAAD